MFLGPVPVNPKYRTHHDENPIRPTAIARHPSAVRPFGERSGIGERPMTEAERTESDDPILGRPEPRTSLHLIEDSTTADATVPQHVDSHLSGLVWARRYRDKLRV